MRFYFTFFIFITVLIGAAAISILIVSQDKKVDESGDIEIPIEEYTTLAEYNNSIDTSCAVDSDCGVKDVHNCCGSFPKCTNTNAQVDTDFVREACAEEELMGICGFPVIQECGCQNNLCVQTK